ncbi:MAG: ATP synthase F1 subunit delta [Myxococcales bacterium]
MNASISRRYARALLEVAASLGGGEADAVAAQLAALAQAVDVSADLRNLLFNPAFDRPQRHQAIGALAGALSLGPTVACFAKLLVDKDRFRLLAEIAASYHELADELAGRARASVTTAAPLPPDVARDMERALSGAVSRQVTIEARVQPALLGGAVAQVGSLLFDGSVRSQLESLRRALKTA